MKLKGFCIGMGLGLLAGGAAVYLLRPKKSAVQKTIDRTRKVMNEAAEELQDRIGL